MRIQKYTVENNIIAKDNHQAQTTTTPSFKGAGIVGSLGQIGYWMQLIEDKGFLASFLIQDMLGMTFPRVGAAFLRDKEVTGQYNIQEGFEVLGREGLTGPCMMAVAPIMLALAAKFGKSTGTNTKLIKRFGDGLKELTKDPNFDKSLFKNATEFEKKFFEININQLLENTLGKGNYKEDSVKFILEQIQNYRKIPTDAKLKKLFGKSKYRDERIAEITAHINDLMYATSEELASLNKVKVGTPSLNNVSEFSTSNAIEAMMKYCDDTIALNKNLDVLDEAAAENLKNSSIAKRFITNVSTVFATLGVMSVLPKIYAKNAIAPGAKTAMQLKNNSIKADEVDNGDKQTDKQEISFKGKGAKPVTSKIGEALSKLFGDKFASHFEYNGHNFTPTLMTCLSLFGLLAPRGKRAYDRAQVNENGKKDLTELYEILIRDISSSLAVVFAVPMITRACVTSYENTSGFVLLHKDRTMSKKKTAMDLLNPYSSAHVMTNAEINALYDNVNTIDKMNNFCKFIDKNGGDLQKILTKAENQEILKELNLDSLKDMSKAEKNKKIVDFFKDLKTKSTDEKALNKSIEELMKGTKGPKNNKILAFAKGLNSVPGFIATFMISPYILGWVLPRLTYANTRRLHQKAEEERNNSKKIATNA